MWADFFATYPNADVEQILEFLDDLRALNGMEPWGG
jgi:hypothetical protein